MDKKTISWREKELKKIVKFELPKLVKSIDSAKGKDAFVLFHQDAFAVDYQNKEMYLLGYLIKYAGIKGVEVRIIGKNRETLNGK